jgi:DNA-binding response OmpR family regulator
MSKKILVVDDEKYLVELLTVNLEPEGFRVIKAFDGETGLDKSLAEKPDLVILDVRLPGMDGYEVCRRIKAQDATRQIPVILLSAYAQDQDIRKGLDVGAQAYIKKPFDVMDFIDMVCRLLQGANDR